ncbi:tetratricopeptide repeat protein [Pyxidicoccus fallax]|uniref:Tetratricopeptide repeat protein n=1 Tax=Pyxidicoccus fallax TaxID=394095 RepID=A0A848LDG2_9BACT|nr:tetratricopeptide repeat protein [Pyxidicoccus fallax]NMO16262.1 tetratricopeptide repeat protein [Pyxidicoccus fallax]NPC78667.1 tetratricopeptide repeat protein [Pyxidicoccus fallax]
MRRSLLVLGCVLVLGCASTPKSKPAAAAPAEAPPPPASAPSATPESPRYLTPQQILKRLEDSQVAYSVEGKDSPPGGWADALWPQRVKAVDYPRVVVRGGERVIQPWPENPQAKALYDEAEPHFQAKRYDEAAKLYTRATEVCPDCYVAWIFRGDAAYFAGDPGTALGHYRKALAINPNDHRSWFFLGNALVQLERYDEALEAWAMCLTLNPRYPVIRQFFRNNASLGLVINEDAIVPRGYAERTPQGISIQFDPDHDPAWLAFANCKALWLGEPSHRQEMTGTTKEHFTSVEELECLGSALAVHIGQKEQGKTESSDPTLDRLYVIAQDGMLLEAVLFEVGARVHPQLVLTMEESSRQRLKTYVLEHVLVPVARAGSYDL